MKYKDGNTWKEITIKALDSMPIGCIILFAGSTIPTGWLKCEGQSLLRTEYSDLFGVINTIYGNADSTHFNLPNYKGRVPVGLNSSDTDFDTLGETGGSKELQEHDHSITPNGYSVDLNASGVQYNVVSGNRSSTVDFFRSGKAGTGNSGNLQPYIVVNYIIKAKNTTPTMASIVDDYSTSTQDGYSCDYVNQVKQDLEDAINDKQDKGTLLWTNPNPSLEFGSQTINFNDTYSYYDIISWVDGVTYETTRVYLNMRTIMQIMEGGFIRTRYATATSNSITFSNGTFFQTYSSGTQNNSQVIPYKIIGYK